VLSSPVADIITKVVEPEFKVPHYSCSCCRCCCCACVRSLRGFRFV